MALLGTIGAGAANTYSTYMFARFVQGFGVSPAATVGMAICMKHYSFILPIFILLLFHLLTIINSVRSLF